MNKRQCVIEPWTNMLNQHMGYVVGYYDDYGLVKVPNGLYKTLAEAESRKIEEERRVK